MLISKFDLYRPEWLELVFDDRNKTYGAYELRQHNSRTMLTAMTIAFTIVIVSAIIVGALVKSVVPIAPPVHITPMVLIDVIHPPAVKPPKPLTHRPPAPTVAPSTPAVMHQFLTPVLAPDAVAKQPPTKTELEPGNIGPINSNGPEGTPAIDPGPGTTPGTVPGNSDVPVSAFGLERMPEPYGGASAWAKFLQKHLKYPEMAADASMQGKVFVSFIVEKDGHLSNFMIDRGMGYGMDEEALRVLKLAPAWKPGIQNGQPVRVKFNIPINFQLGDDNN